MRQDLTALTDKELVTLTQTGNSDAWGVLFQRHRERLHKTIYFLIKDQNQSLVDDLLQDTFIKAHEYLMKENGYSEKNQFFSWITRISKNLVIDYMRRKKHSPPVLHMIQQDTLECDKFSFDECLDLGFVPGKDVLMERDETIEIIERLLGKLNPNLRETFILRYYAELPFKQIARITGVPISTSIGRVRYSLYSLRKMLNVPKHTLIKAV